jgi:hypothetical protein
MSVHEEAATDEEDTLVWRAPRKRRRRKVQIIRKKDFEVPAEPDGILHSTPTHRPSWSSSPEATGSTKREDRAGTP